MADDGWLKRWFARPTQARERELAELTAAIERKEQCIAELRGRLGQLSVYAKAVTERLDRAGETTEALQRRLAGARAEASSERQRAESAGEDTRRLREQERARDAHLAAAREEASTLRTQLASTESARQAVEERAHVLEMRTRGLEERVAAQQTQIEHLEAENRREEHAHRRHSDQLRASLRSKRASEHSALQARHDELEHQLAQALRPQPASGARMALLADTLWTTITASTQALDIALGSRAHLGIELGFRAVRAELRERVGACATLGEALERVGQYLRDGELVAHIDAVEDGGGRLRLELGLARTVELESRALGCWLAAHALTALGAVLDREYRVLAVDFDAAGLRVEARVAGASLLPRRLLRQPEVA